MNGREIVVVYPGLLTTVQDLGRTGHAHLGVSPGGAVDRQALLLANALVGNDETAAALEMTVTGPRLQMRAETWVALAGEGWELVCGGEKVDPYMPKLASGGTTVECRRRMNGSCRAYLAFSGGVAVPPVMGSRSTDLGAALGGLDGRALRSGDRVPLDARCGKPRAVPVPDGLRPRRPPAPVVRVVLGPHRESFGPAALSTFLSSSYTVESQSDRVGCRLNGPRLDHVGQADVLSMGIPPGAIQVPGHGSPIILLSNRPTMGGYPIIATAVSADLDLVARLLPGESLRFQAVSVLEAERLGADTKRRWNRWLAQTCRAKPETHLVRRFLLTVGGRRYLAEVED